MDGEDARQGSWVVGAAREAGRDGWYSTVQQSMLGLGVEGRGLRGCRDRVLFHSKDY